VAKIMKDGLRLSSFSREPLKQVILWDRWLSR
jgi:hypothetical protein